MPIDQTPSSTARRARTSLEFRQNTSAPCARGVKDLRGPGTASGFGTTVKSYSIGFPIYLMKSGLAELKPRRPFLINWIRHFKQPNATLEITGDTQRLIGRHKLTQQEKQMSYESFQTRDPSQQTILIDVGRAEVLLNCFEAPYLDTPEALSKFVGSLH